ncbi:PREDICTED: proteolipid protein 2-like [Ficedula albicollis]|uniref:proteolipid protein 2-like n=1 Tax=Ficedula albicollis TaxID=59894 RepID=UPI0007AD8835|nr:PREDICTED: proteolipid protein 2-like [Ficedula albicollis]
MATVAERRGRYETSIGNHTLPYRERYRGVYRGRYGEGRSIGSSTVAYLGAYGTSRDDYRGARCTPQVLCLLTLICFGASRSGYAGLAAVELVFAALVLLAWSLRGPICAPQDFMRCLIGALLFLITSLIVIVGHRDGAGIAGGVFGILAGVLLGYDAFITLPTRQGHTAAPTESPDGA